MTAQQQKNLYDWIFKQTPLAVILILSNIFQYQYFTGQMDKRDYKIEKLEDKIDNLQRQIFINKFTYKK